jgi:hypothetical protein
MTTPYWIEKGWGDSVQNATIKDIEIAINEIIKMDDEHGAFWVGQLEKENVMEVHKGLELFYIKSDKIEEQLKIKLNNWNEVKEFYQLFFEDKFETLEKEVRKHIVD